MAKIGNRLKIALLKGMEAVGKGASNLASNAHLKVSEINLETRRREILSEFPLRAHDLWQKGVELPPPLGDMMSELNDLDERLSVLRAQRYATVEGASAKPEDAQDEPATADEDSAAPCETDACEGDDAQQTADIPEHEQDDAEHEHSDAEHEPQPASDDAPADNSADEPHEDAAPIEDAPTEGDNA